MGRTAKPNRGVINVKQNIFSNDFSYMLNHEIEKVYKKTFEEVYGHKKAEWLTDEDADNFITYRMNQSGANISPANFNDTNPSVQNLSQHLSETELRRAYAYLQNTNILHIKKYLNSVVKDREKYYKYAYFDGQNDTKYVKNISGKNTKWEFHDSGWNIKKPFISNTKKYVAEINPLTQNAKSTPSVHLLRIYDDNRKMIDEERLPVFFNDTFTSMAQLVKSADNYLDKFYGQN